MQTLAVVVAEGWPTWLEVLPALGFQDVKVWCQDTELLTSFYSTLHEECIFDELDDLSHISKFRQPMLFLSGSRSFVKRIEAQLLHLQIWLTISAQGLGGKWEKVVKLKAFSWKGLRHSQVGNVTNRNFWVGYNQADNLSPELDPNFQYLKDVLSPIKSGLPSKTPHLKIIYWQEGELKLMVNDGVVGHSSLFPYLVSL
jgi:hypothetical protein